jgi:hypothetical protein
MGGMPTKHRCTLPVMIVIAAVGWAGVFIQIGIRHAAPQFYGSAVAAFVLGIIAAWITYLRQGK